MAGVRAEMGEAPGTDLMHERQGARQGTSPCQQRVQRASDPWHLGDLSGGEGGKEALRVDAENGRLLIMRIERGNVALNLQQLEKLGGSAAGRGGTEERSGLWCWNVVVLLFSGTEMRMVEIAQRESRDPS
jgi:hypothetical protein